MSDPILSVEDLVTQFHVEEGTVQAVNGVSLDVEDGETLGIVGESGSGKSVTALSVLGLIDEPGRIEQGRIRFEGEDLLEKSDKEMRAIRGDSISMIFQDPMASLNPVYTVGAQIRRVIQQHQDIPKRAAKERAIELLDDVGIPDPERRFDNYPHQFSGGMRQRALIAMAMSCEPDLLIADEPTTALDVTIEAQVFEVLNDVKEKFDTSVILITHDLGVVADSCDRAVIMYGGKIVERGDIEDLFVDPRHPYTRGLLRSMPRLSGSIDRLEQIGGEIPDPINLPDGCSFAPRCPHATEACREYDPELRAVEGDHEAACIHAEGYGTVDGLAAAVDADVEAAPDAAASSVAGGESGGDER